MLLAISLVLFSSTAQKTACQSSRHLQLLRKRDCLVMAISYARSQSTFTGTRAGSVCNLEHTPPNFEYLTGQGNERAVRIAPKRRRIYYKPRRRSAALGRIVRSIGFHAPPRIVKDIHALYPRLYVAWVIYHRAEYIGCHTVGVEIDSEALTNRHEPLRSDAGHDPHSIEIRDGGGVVKENGAHVLRSRKLEEPRQNLLRSPGMRIDLS